MNTGIQILIERMKTNPEEFTTPRVTVSDKWESLLKDYWKHLPEEDKAAYQQARDAIMQDEFTEMVMKKLAGEELNPLSYTEALAFSMKNTKGVLAAGLMKTFKAQYETEDFTNAFKVNE